MIADAEEIAEHIRALLSQRKVILVGQSWGSFLGMNVIMHHPELFHAFVGTGQLVSVAETIADRVQWTRQQAITAGEQPALKALDDAAALPPDQRLEAEAKASSKGLISPPDASIAKIVTDFIRDKSNAEAVDYMAGNRFTGSKLKSITDTMDLRKLGLDMPIPTFVIQGRDDRIAGFTSVKAYVDDLRAPMKAFISIDGGHYACFTNAADFIADLNEHVRPLALR